MFFLGGLWINDGATNHTPNFLGYRLGISTTQYSKAFIIDTALRNDAEFIEKCNFMDYSLLVGIDEENKEIVVGVVGKCVLCL